jgi:hypothetical protein
MIEVIIRKVSANDTTAEPLTVFNLGEPGEVIAEHQLYRVRLSDQAEAAKSRDATGAASHKEASMHLLRLVHGIIGRVLESDSSERKPIKRKSPKGWLPSGLGPERLLGR